MSRPLVIDFGSGWSKAGFAGEEAPESVFPSIVGRPRHQELMVGLGQRECYIGAEAQSKRGILTVKYPIEHGVVIDWDDMHKICNHLFEQELKVKPEDHPILIAESPLNPRTNREKMCQLMFETFHTPALNLSLGCALALHASGLTTGLVLDSGETVTHAVPIYDGLLLTEGIVRLEVGGRDLSQHLIALSKDIFPFTNAERDLARQIKEKVCYVAQDIDTEATVPKTYQLPDGQVITFGRERFTCAEALFRTGLLGLEAPGLHEMIHLSIAKCALDVRKELYASVVLSGGNTMFPGMAQRVHRELEGRAARSRVKVVAPDDRVHSVWIGGSILASMSTFPQMCISETEYDEVGSGIVHRK